MLKACTDTMGSVPVAGENFLPPEAKSAAETPSAPLPNGHWIGLINTFGPCTGRPECSSNPNILGDVLVDLAPQPDGTFFPVWVWNSFDHLDVTRAPMSVADWTHSNAILYSPDDGNLLLSMRHQSWILKIDYNNGQGTGNVLWHLGYQGDFTLLGGTDPTGWFYAQHEPAFATANTTGKFSLAIMDNGHKRVFSPGVTCGVQGSPPCLYSSSLLLQIGEDAKTATIVFHYLPDEFSAWGGGALQLANGNLEPILMPARQEPSLIFSRCHRNRHLRLFGICVPAHKTLTAGSACRASIQGCSGERRSEWRLLST